MHNCTPAPTNQKFPLCTRCQRNFHASVVYNWSRRTEAGLRQVYFFFLHKSFTLGPFIAEDCGCEDRHFEDPALKEPVTPPPPGDPPSLAQPEEKGSSLAPKVPGAEGMKRTLPAINKERALRTRDPRSGGAHMVDGQDNAWRSRAPGLTHTETQRIRLWTA